MLSSDAPKDNMGGMPLVTSSTNFFSHLKHALACRAKIAGQPVNVLSSWRCLYLCQEHSPLAGNDYDACLHYRVDG